MPIMGYGLMVYAVDLERLRREVGCGDAELAASYGAGFTADDRETQDFIDDCLPDGPERPTLADVARQVIMGEPYDERIGFAYGYFLKWLCERHGVSQWNNSLMPIPVDYLSTLDTEFTKAGLLTPEVSIHDLGWGGAPVPVPMGDPWPGIGHLEHEHLAAAAELLAGTPNSDLPEEFHDAAYDLFQMMAHARDDKRSLVGFFH
jgi:hypothetical protein